MSAFRGSSGPGSQATWAGVLLSLAWRIGAVAALMYVLTRWPPPRLVAAMARSQELPLAQARWVITTFPQWESNRALLHALQAAQFNGCIVGAVRDAAHGRALEAAGVKYILNPFDDAADHAAQRLATQIHSKEDLS